MGRYEDFWAVTEAALTHACRRLDVPADGAARARLLDVYHRLAPFPEVPAALARLRGLPRGILSNGSPAMLARVVRHAGLEADLDPVISVDAVRVYKPAPAVYALGPARLNRPASVIGFVSSNAWDVAGAKAFGYHVTWVNRQGALAEELGVAPDVEVSDLAHLAGPWGADGGQLPAAAGRPSPAGGGLSADGRDWVGAGGGGPRRPAGRRAPGAGVRASRPGPSDGRRWGRGRACLRPRSHTPGRRSRTCCRSGAPAGASCGPAWPAGISGRRVVASNSPYASLMVSALRNRLVSPPVPAPTMISRTPIPATRCLPHWLMRYWFDATRYVALPAAASPPLPEGPRGGGVRVPLEVYWGARASIRSGDPEAPRRRRGGDHQAEEVDRGGPQVLQVGVLHQVHPVVGDQEHVDREQLRARSWPAGPRRWRCPCR